MKTKILILSTLLFTTHGFAAPFKGFSLLSEQLSSRMIHNIELVSTKALTIGSSRNFVSKTKVTLRILDKNIEVYVSNSDINLFYFNDIFDNLPGKITYIGNDSTPTLKFISASISEEDDLKALITTINQRLDELFTDGISSHAANSYLSLYESKFLSSLSTNKTTYNKSKREITTPNPKPEGSPFTAGIRLQLNSDQQPRVYANFRFTPHKIMHFNTNKPLLLSEIIPEELKKLGLEKVINYKIFNFHFYLELKDNARLSKGENNIDVLKTALNAIFEETASRVFLLQ